MSINLSANLGSFSNKFKKTEESEEDKQKKNRAAKQNPLLNAVTDPYVDDNEAFKTRISKLDKYEYWTTLLQNRGVRRPLPKGFKSWRQREIASVNEQSNYSKFHVRMFDFISSANWDHRSINIFILWLFLVVFYVDGYALSMHPPLITWNSKNQIVAVGPLLIFFCQLVPFLGMLYFISHCNDLVHFKAIKGIGSWAVCAALTAQYVEFFLYAGHGHPERAGQCKTGHDPNPTPILDYARRVVNTMRRRNHAKVDREDSDDNSENSSSQNGSDNDKSVHDIEVGKVPTQLKSALKKPATGVGEDGRNGAPGALAGTGAGANIGARRKPSINNRRKSSASFSILSKGSSDGRRRSGEIVDFDEDGNVIEKVPVPHTEWKCVVCNRRNNRPTHGPVESDIWFGEKGVYYKRTYAVIQARRDVPTCTKCGTYADYTPPLGSAHLFKYNPKPHAAFDNYPVPSTVQAGLKPDIKSRYYYSIKGFFLGIKDNINSAPLKNDWRLEKFVNNRFPELPRYILPPGELFQVGEIVECKQQKFAWARAKVQVAHPNHTYDIRYDPGDEIRFVAGSSIRTIPDKRAYAFRVEMGLVVLCVMSPLGMAMGLMAEDLGLSMVGLLMVSVTLLAIRLVVAVQYFYNYRDAGLIAVMKLSTIYTLPLLFLMIAAAIGVGSGTDPSSWLTVAVMLLLTKVFSLPYLYIYRPQYLVLGSSIFVLSTLGTLGLGIFATNQRNIAIALPLAPILILAIWVKIVRTQLHNFWDVCLVIRKTKDTELENPSIVGKVVDFVQTNILP